MRITFRRPLSHPALSLLTTDHQYPLRSLTTTADTSAATALAAKAITELWEDYPHLWPETIRAIFVSSARWTRQMEGAAFPANPSKGDFIRISSESATACPIRRAQGVAPTMLWPSSFKTRSLRTGQAPPLEPSPVHNQMKFFELPWPREALRQSGCDGGHSSRGTQHFCRTQSFGSGWRLEIPLCLP